MALPPVDYALVSRLEDACAPFGIARLEALEAAPQSGLELRIERFGSAVAPAAPLQPELDFVNRVERLGPADAGRLPEILAFYRELGIDPWFDLAPARDVAELGAALAAAGAQTIGFHAVLYATPDVPPASDVPVRRADGGADEQHAATLLLEGSGVPPDVRATHAPALADAVNRVRGSLYVATIDGSPAGAAALTVVDGIGYLASAATLPAFRRRGSQTALIAARVADALDADCELVVSGAEFGSQSQRNLERAGFRVAYTKPVLRLSSRAAAGPARTA